MATGIYIHIPFCLSKCPYCDFNSIVYESFLSEEYINFLLKEIKTFSRNLTEKVSVGTIYFGGGTPSILKTSQLGKILEAIFTCFEIKKNPEITLEANPGTLTKKKGKELKGVGINRISLGVQSFVEEELKILGRAHNRTEALNSYWILRDYFENLSLDLIFGIPEQSQKNWRKSLSLALKLMPEHLSTYCLSLEEGTPFHRLWKAKRLNLPQEEKTRKMYLEAINLLQSEGYRHYELSNFALKGFECKHNLNYWQGGEYFGFGAGAHSYHKGIRWANIEDIADYIKKLKAGTSIVDFKEALNPTQKIDEFILLSLRRAEGIDLKMLKKELNYDLERNKREEIKDLIERSFLKKEKDNLRLTLKGILVADSIIQRLTK